MRVESKAEPLNHGPRFRFSQSCTLWAIEWIMFMTFMRKRRMMMMVKMMILRKQQTDTCDGAGKVIFSFNPPPVEFSFN